MNTPGDRFESADHPDWARVAFRWHLAEIALLILLLYFCFAFEIPAFEQAYHVALSLASFAFVRCLESANRMDERVTECSNLRQAARQLHMVRFEDAFQRRLAHYRLKCRNYQQFTLLSLISWAVVAHSYVYGLHMLHEGKSVNWWITFVAFAATAVAVVTAVVKSWKSSLHDPEICVVRFSGFIRKMVEQVKQKSA